MAKKDGSRNIKIFDEHLTYKTKNYHKSYTENKTIMTFYSVKTNGDFEQIMNIELENYSLILEIKGISVYMVRN